MRQYIFFLTLLLISACTSDTESEASYTLNVSGVPVQILNDEPSTRPSIVRKGNMLEITIPFASQLNHFNELFLWVDIDKGLVKAGIPQHTGGSATIGYFNYQNHPSNYFLAEVTAINTEANKVKISFNGRLYSDPMDISSDFVEVEGHIDAGFTNGQTFFPLIYKGVLQHCTATLDGEPWTAYNETAPGEFLSADPYKIEVDFSDVTTGQSFPLDGSDAPNNMRFAKFNDLTLQYEYYDLVGSFTGTAIEYHGGMNWSIFGNFSFTAMNPSNPSDVIEVTNGSFKAYQEF